ncbi:MAG TPA: hypothetical protein VM367_16200, partial [Pseudonocardia sp.]|nr:hypothetical protein [Pseudonocardia sp.]
PPATRTDPPATRTDPPATTTDPPPPAPVAVATAAGATTPVQAVRAGEGGSLVLVLSPGTLTPWPVPGEAITLRFSDGRTELRTVTGGDAAAGTVTVA